MTKVTLRNVLIVTTLAMVIAFLVSITPHFYLADNNPLLLLSLLLMVLMIVLQCCYELQTERQPEPTPVSLVLPEKAVILILGPYAAKWFSQSNYTDSVRYSNQATWLRVSEPKELSKHLDYVASHHPGAQIITFFPFLPDGHETSTTMISQLSRWQNSFSNLVDRLSLPCVFALYARLSNESRSHDPDNATWIGELDLEMQSPVTLKTALDSLRQKLMSEQSLADQIQRAALGHHLLNWLEDSGIAPALETLFAHSPLQLTNVLLCDHGKGFTRHGAWSAWLEQHYAILPALGAGPSLPPFPRVIVPPMSPSRLPVLAPVAKKSLPKVLWSICLATLLLTFHLLYATWQSKEQQQAFRQQMAPYETLSGLSIQKLQKSLAALQQIHNTYASCANTQMLQHWGLSPCPIFAAHVKQHIDQLSSISTFSTTGLAALFDSGSTQLRPDASHMLREIGTLANQHPNQDILIIGHSDITGNDDINMSLSEQRAITVRNWLIQQYNISPERLNIRAVGASEPVASNDTTAGREQNRRVEVLVLPLQSQKDGVSPK